MRYQACACVSWKYLSVSERTDSLLSVYHPPVIFRSLPLSRSLALSRSLTHTLWISHISLDLDLSYTIQISLSSRLPSSTYLSFTFPTVFDRIERIAPEQYSPFSINSVRFDSKIFSSFGNSPPAKYSASLFRTSQFLGCIEFEFSEVSPPPPNKQNRRIRQIWRAHPYRIDFRTFRRSGFYNSFTGSFLSISISFKRVEWFGMAHHPIFSV